MIEWVTDYDGDDTATIGDLVIAVTEWEVFGEWCAVLYRHDPRGPRFGCDRLTESTGHATREAARAAGIELYETEVGK